jgi:hypothetical protein
MLKTYLIISGLGFMAPVKKDPEPASAAGGVSSTPDSFQVEAANNVRGDKPATADDISEEEIREKVQGGLTRQQAITVIKVQRAEDAEKAKGNKGR